MRLKTLLFLFILLITSSTQAQIASFTFKTVTNNGTYSPKHVLAVWVEKADGTFIRTLKLRGNTRKQWLITWNSKTAGNTTDASTGSTISSHTTHYVNWNLRDLGGNLVPDGNYKIVVEFTDKHSQGPMFTLTFAKNSTYSSQFPANQTNFTNMSFVFDPVATNLEEYDSDENLINLYPNPASGKVNFTFEQSVLQSGNIEIIDVSGKLVFNMKIENSEMSKPVSVDLSNLPAGVYFVVFKSEGQIVRQKIILT